MLASYGSIIIGAIQILIAVTILATIIRRGKNPYLSVLGFCFVLIGVFGFFPQIAFVLNAVYGLKVADLFFHIIFHTSTYFGVAGYVIFIVSMIYGQKIIIKITIPAFVVALFFTIIHFAHVELLQFGFEKRVFIDNLAHFANPIFFLMALMTGGAMLGLLFFQMRKNKQGVLGYTTTVCIGLSLMASALIILKSLEAVPGYEMGGPLAIGALVFLLIGFIVQITLIVQPGMVYNYETREPIPLALVKVFDEDNRILESRATGQNGRYVILLNPGIYTIKVAIAGYKFPTSKKIGYRGEILKVLRPRILSLDIALDPVDKA